MSNARINSTSVAKAAREIRRAQPAAWKATRGRLREIGEVVAADVREATSYSSRIPGSVRVRVTAGGNVGIVVGGDSAPNAVPIENGGKGFVRHRVFGQDVWTSRNSRPAFLTPTAAKRQEWALAEMERTYWDAYIRVFERGG